MSRGFGSGKIEGDIRSETVRVCSRQRKEGKAPRQRKEGQAPPLRPLPSREVQGVVWPLLRHRLRHRPSRWRSLLVSSPAQGRPSSDAVAILVGSRQRKEGKAPRQ